MDFLSIANFDFSVILSLSVSMLKKKVFQNYLTELMFFLCKGSDQKIYQQTQSILLKLVNFVTELRIRLMVATG